VPLLERELFETGGFHRRQVLRELLVRSHETNKLSDNAIVAHDLAYFAETLPKSLEIPLVVVRPPSVAERVKGRTFPLIRFRNPIGCRCLPPPQHLPAMIKHVNARIRRRRNHELCLSLSEDLRVHLSECICRRVVEFDHWPLGPQCFDALPKRSKTIHD